MQRPLHEHIAHLEQKIEAFKAGLNDPNRSIAEKMDLRLDLDMAERALVHFRKAFDLEQRLSK